MAELKVKGSKRKAIEASVKADQCIIEGCTDKLARRGLCIRHSAQFYNSLKPLSDEEKLKREQQLIVEGLVLPTHQVTELRDYPDNPFRNVS